MENKKVLGILPKMAEKIGQKSVRSACLWWVCQPKVPTSMMNKSKKD